MYSEKPKLHKKNRQYTAGNLRSLIIDVTSRCNMRCPHCYFDTFMNHNPVPLEKLKTAMDEAHEMGVFHYILTGGEPTMDLDRLAAVIELTRPDESYINITSNGWNFDRAMARHLRELKADKVVFSLDSGVEEEHDRGRGEGLYQYVLAAVDNVLAEGLLSTISFTATHQTLYSERFKAALECFWPRLSRGGVFVFDEYAIRGWPGETTAVDEFFADKPDVRIRTFHWTNSPAGYIVKQ